MLTLEKLKMYRFFKGDIVLFDCHPNKKMDYNEFWLIGQFVQGLILIKREFVLEGYRQEWEKTAKEAFGDQYPTCRPLLDEMVIDTFA